MSSFPVKWPTEVYNRKRFERLNCPKSIPWSLVEPHDAQARLNHGKNLKRLSYGGGLTPQELVAVLEDASWKTTYTTPDQEAIERLKELCQNLT